MASIEKFLPICNKWASVKLTVQPSLTLTPQTQFRSEIGQNGEWSIVLLLTVFTLLLNLNLTKLRS